MVGACRVVICINLLSTLVGILEFPNLVKLPKFTFNAGKIRKISLYIFSKQTHSKNSKVQRIVFVTFVAIDHGLSQCLVGVETKASRPRQCWLFTFFFIGFCLFLFFFFVSKQRQVGLVSVGYSRWTMGPPQFQLITPWQTFYYFSFVPIQLYMLHFTKNPLRHLSCVVKIELN